MESMVVNVGRLKGYTRSFLSQGPNVQAVLVWDQKTKNLEINLNDMGVGMRLDENTMNADGDYMTDEEKQDIVDKLQAIVDEHNNNLTEE